MILITLKSTTNGDERRRAAMTSFYWSEDAGGGGGGSSIITYDSTERFPAFNMQAASVRSANYLCSGWQICGGCDTGPGQCRRRVPSSVRRRRRRLHDGASCWQTRQQTPPFATDVRNLISTPVAGAATEQQRRQQTQLVACLTMNNEVHLLRASEGGIIAARGTTRHGHGSLLT